MREARDYRVWCIEETHSWKEWDVFESVGLGSERGEVTWVNFREEYTETQTVHYGPMTVSSHSRSEKTRGSGVRSEGDTPPERVW